MSLLVLVYIYVLYKQTNHEPCIVESVTQSFITSETPPVNK